MRADSAVGDSSSPCCSANWAGPSPCARFAAAGSEGKLRHLGLPQAPARSTLAYANERRPWQLYEELFQQLLTQCQGLAVQRSAGRRQFRFKHKLISLDATVIDLCASVFDWARFRRTKGAVKLHLLLDHDGFLPCYAVITEGKQHEIKCKRKSNHTVDG